MTSIRQIATALALLLTSGETRGFSPADASHRGFAGRASLLKATDQTAQTSAVYDSKTTNTLLERYKSDHAYSLSNNAAYWNQRATDLLTWEHYPYDENNLEGVMTGGFEHGDVGETGHI